MKIISCASWFTYLFPKSKKMRTDATLKNMNSDSCRSRIIRNLNRIMDVRVIEINIESHILSFVYSTQKAFEDVKKELARIGHPIIQYSNVVSKTKNGLGTGPRGLQSANRSRPRYTIHQ